MKTLHTPLFSVKSGREKLEEIKKRAIYELDRMEDSKFSDEIIRSTINSLIESHKIFPVVIEENRKVNEPKKTDGKKLWSIELSFVGSPEVFSIKPTQGNIERPRADIKHTNSKGNHLLFEYEMEIEYELDYPNDQNHKAIGIIKELLPYVNEVVKEINTAVKESIERKAYQRKSSIERDQDYLKQI